MVKPRTIQVRYPPYNSIITKTPTTIILSMIAPTTQVVKVALKVSREPKRDWISPNLRRSKNASGSLKVVKQTRLPLYIDERAHNQ